MTSVIEKAAQAFRTIGEVSEELNVPQHVLRFWETRFTQVKPLKRGGNRRYYRPEDVDLLRTISHLHYVDGYTLKGVQKLLQENGPKALVLEFLGQRENKTSVILAEQHSNTTKTSEPANKSASDKDTKPSFEIKAIISELKAIRALLVSK